MTTIDEFYAAAAPDRLMKFDQAITRECITQAVAPEEMARFILAEFEPAVLAFVKDPGRELRIRLLVVDGAE